MKNALEIAVTLSSELLDHLGVEARLLDVPVEYLVAGLIVDTFEEVGSDGERVGAVCA